MSELLYFAEHRLQEVALAFLDIAYILRIIWLFKFKAAKDLQAQTGPPGATPGKGVIYSWANIAMPWAMESARNKFGFYLQFVVFHLGVATSIALSFIIPYAPGLLKNILPVIAMQVIIGAALLVGCYRIYRRVSQPFLRAISTPDDYFSLILLNVWFAVAILAAPNRPEQGEAALLIYFLMTAFFLFYVPFSKIIHYLYYPFTNYYFGKTMGYRGVYPLKRSQKPNPIVHA